MRIHVVDAFTDRPFAGNPAGVCLLPAGPWPEDRWLLQVAAEMRHSETAFARPLPDAPDADWELRWFTPVVEVGLCGHATLATRHVLRTELGTLGPVRFATRRSGVLVADADAEGSLTLDFPAAPATEVPVPDGLAAALGTTGPLVAHETGRLGILLTVLPDEAAVRAVVPDLTALAELLRREDFGGVLVTAAAAAPAAGHDFVSRVFAPTHGIPEDPVTGSAHTALAPYWAARLGRDRLTGLQVSERTGLVRTALHGDRVHLTGDAVTVLDGTLHV